MGSICPLRGEEAVETLPGLKHHIYLRPDCGICGVRLEDLEQCLILLGNESSTGLSRLTAIFRFPVKPHRKRAVEDLFLCGDPHCPRYYTSPDTATVHAECYNTLARGCDVADRGNDLWTTAAWRAAWPYAKDLRLVAPPVAPDIEAADRLGLSGMGTLPAEICHAIWGHSPSAPFWRYSAARHLARQVSSTSRGHLTRVPLCEVSFWERGRQPVVKPADDGTLIRITIDSHGLQQIERLRVAPPVRTWRTDKLAFALMYPDDYESWVVYFSFGLARLKLRHKASYGPKLWDTPTPPPLKECTLSVPLVPPESRFHTIDLRTVTGLTFFLYGNFIYGVHGHTPGAPVASPWPRAPQNGRHLLPKWVYVPVSGGDSIVAMGTRQAGTYRIPYHDLTVLIRLKIAGDVIVGNACDASLPDIDVIFGPGPPLLLVINTLEKRSVTLLGAYTPPSDALVPAPFPHPSVDRHLNRPCYSAAPLSNITRALVFHKEGARTCRGILFHYANGAKRAVGECRVGVDPSISFAAPARICVSEVVDTLVMIGAAGELPLHGTMVRFSAGKDHGHEGEGWVCSEMRGEVRFWFTVEETMVLVHEE